MKTIISILMVFMSVQVYSQWGSTMSLDGEPGSNAPVDVTLTENEVVLSGLDEACASLPAVFHIPLENGFSDGFDIEIEKQQNESRRKIHCQCGKKERKRKMKKRKRKENSFKLRKNQEKQQIKTQRNKHKNGKQKEN